MRWVVERKRPVVGLSKTSKFSHREGSWNHSAFVLVSEITCLWFRTPVLAHCGQLSAEGHEMLEQWVDVS